ncbi:MAG TPA: hypothetical protein VMT35_19110, partial [Ignavibacteriaceae bacterium]|nr:hypothetical protein [Ignavibacteriaceae bacterium]
FSILPDRFAERLRSSYIYKKFFFSRKASRNDVMRTIEIIKKSNQLLFDHKITLYVFVWDIPIGIENAFSDKNDYFFFIDQLKRDNVNILFLHDAIPDFNENENSYTFPNDGHPNSLGNKKIAEYLNMQINNSEKR